MKKGKKKENGGRSSVFLTPSSFLFFFWDDWCAISVTWCMAIIHPLVNTKNLT